MELITYAFMAFVVAVENLPWSYIAVATLAMAVTFVVFALLVGASRIGPLR
jgi:hypothetical protein